MGAQLRQLRRRIRSVRSIAKITRAQELIASSRIVRAQQRMQAALPYLDDFVAGHSLGEYSALCAADSFAVPTAARLLKLPYFPITPLFPWFGPLGAIPLPSKWIIEIGAPIATDHIPPAAADDPTVIFKVTDQVRETIQQTLYSLLMERESVFR